MNYMANRGSAGLLLKECYLFRIEIRSAEHTKSQFSIDYPNSPGCPHRHGRVPVVGHPTTDPNSNRHGRVPVVGF